ncbi:MAG: tRNA glutamyl-Q(34) synthetase GluQRS [Cytophagales bacterium]|nr:tRNA glutamyl-Q(34) synthetase GluQRS [Cytophagales bacterium]
MTRYIGRFAPSPTGPLHAGSLVAALASWLDARAHGGRWLVRIEDVDTPRCIAGMDEIILNQLTAFGMVSDTPVRYQSQRTERYEAALAQLTAQNLVYRCSCSRSQIAMHGSGIYPGTCRQALPAGLPRSTSPASQYAYRLRVGEQLITWFDRRLGPHTQNLAKEVGDFVIKRADGLFAYQLAVVVDDLAQGVTHVVRGADLADNTARQIFLQGLLDKAYSKHPVQYLHVPLVLAADGKNSPNKMARRL